ncbi:MAG: multifunctional CCA tRNA nucleotidyl transferase/2'3'-cyclic phosphodiesterase/2'nucleotidase/phosphatase [Aquabacterium sp.]
MKAWLVGGTVRDQLLGVPASDRDWVVVGSSPQAMVDAGFKPVGRDFPVFLHPQTGDEYALARTERKSAPGYHGFVFHADPGVTLEQDLARRDLTINAMAMDPDSGELVDPFGGQADLAAGLLRHVGQAFAEDPVRLLRLARFAARWPDFVVAPQTLALARAIVDRGEADALVPERVWQELSRGLMAARPSRMLTVLRYCGALPRLAPELAALWAPSGASANSDTPPGPVDAGAHLERALDLAAGAGSALPVRFACLCLGLDVPATQQLCDRWRAPQDCQEMALLLVRERAAVHATARADARRVMDLLERGDAWRRPQRFLDLLQAVACDARAAGADPSTADRLHGNLRAALSAALAADVAAASREALAAGLRGVAVGDAVRAARQDAVRRTWPEPATGAVP